ncbi:AsmA family protein [Oleiagrimonas soli]|uniref:AsmA protein n=1 Tax=Oleiagrimonas soli TaxID=1543381 RepID=A0A099CUA5_9GAMM|nr:AsmA family protein [Oleiagrimonas soli]KGI77212.1 hypothetical protein LF63_0111435 [Oleiagrimonas soli]MBB6185613.1 AsmA protein [Oleiagrimonas soli]
MSRRLRITLLSIAGVVLALVIAALIVAYVLLRPARFTETLRGAARNAGLELTLSAPARPTLWPRPGVQLQGMQVFAKNQADPILIADHGQIVVPWRTLFGGPTAINRLELDSPRLDLNQLQLALSALPSKPGGGASLPSIDAGIAIHNGTLVRNNAVLLQNASLQTGALLPGHPFSLTASGESASGEDLRLSLTFTPQKNPQGAIDLRQLRLNAYGDKDSKLQLSGEAQWLGGPKLSLALKGDMTLHGGQLYQLDVGSDAADTRLGGRLHVKIQGPKTSADLQLSPLELSAWWKRIAGDHPPGPLPPPPVDGSLDADALSFGDVQIKGLKLRSGTAVPAVAGSSAPAVQSAETK